MAAECIASAHYKDPYRVPECQDFCLSVVNASPPKLDKPFFHHNFFCIHVLIRYFTLGFRSRFCCDIPIEYIGLRKKDLQGRSSTKAAFQPLPRAHHTDWPQNYRRAMARPDRGKEGYPKNPTNDQAENNIPRFKTNQPVLSPRPSDAGRKPLVSRYESSRRALAPGFGD
jgi:hypothetical protein